MFIVYLTFGGEVKISKEKEKAGRPLMTMLIPSTIFLNSSTLNLARESINQISSH